VMFAIARTVGWVAQWMEMISEPDQRIGRPRQVYDGPACRDYIPIGSRKKTVPKGGVDGELNGEARNTD
jgi:hypothetical protein